MTYTEELIQQRAYFQQGHTLNLRDRLTHLKALRAQLYTYEQKIYDALLHDLGKSAQESYLTEFSPVIAEINTMIKNLPKWMKRRSVKTPFFLFPSKSYTIFEPYGVVMILSPWNYPFQLLMLPLVGALAAGNCIMAKPAHEAPYTCAVMAEILQGIFPKEHVSLVTGGREATQELLQQKFDYIFFTGGPNFGKAVAQYAAQNLTPCTLELGGKSPCIVTPETNIPIAAKRIVWGKLLNAGQTCIAPDYLLVDESIVNDLTKYMIRELDSHWAKDDMEGKDVIAKPTFYPLIISQESTQRLSKLIEGEKIIYGGIYDIEKRYFSPTLIDNPKLSSPVMQDEIFGPILPVITYTKLDEAIAIIKQGEKPLSLYLFGNKNQEKEITEKVSSGTVCINDTVMQFSNGNLPFGGVGKSGMGHYHHLHSFKTFSHTKGVLRASTHFDLKFRYAPYIIPAFIKRFLEKP